MSTLSQNIPLSLYIHIPWCVKKCPYCDFNSYALGRSSASEQGLPEADYIKILEQDLLLDLPYVFNRPLQSIFFGGGTPSLFSPQAFEKILNNIQTNIAFASNIEITMEANPGTLEHKCFTDYKAAGINRISLGVQSFQNEKLKALGRIHLRQDLDYAFESLARANFHNFNIDLMFGLPNQSIADAIFDLETALAIKPAHLSWYHLTLEPNTYFHKYPPVLPSDYVTETIQNEGLQLLTEHGFRQYEVSAFAKPGFESRHNLNYWTFGDYLGIGAGAHGKISNPVTKEILRYAKTRSPISYLNPKQGWIAESRNLTSAELPLEFMLNALRLTNEIPLSLFEQRCFLPVETLSHTLQKAQELGFITLSKDSNILLTALGKRFLNNVVELFLKN